MDQYSGDSLAQPLLRPNAGGSIAKPIPGSKRWRRRTFALARPYKQACAVVARIGRLVHPRTTETQPEPEDDDLEPGILPTRPDENESAVRLLDQALAREEQQQRDREEEEQYEQGLDEFDRRFDNSKNSLDLARERLTHSLSSSGSEQSKKGSRKVYRLGRVWFWL